MISNIREYKLNFRNFLFIYLIILLFAQANFSQYSKANYKILGIRVEGNASADATTIIANSGLKTGDEIEYPGEQTTNAIKRLFNLRIFSDVQILIEKKIDDGVFLILKVAEHPRIEKFVIEGNDELSETDIKKKVDFITGQIIKPRDKFDIIRKLKLAYAEEGYLNPTVNVLEFVFSAIDSNDEEYTISWANQKDKSDVYKTNYDKKEVTSYRTLEKIKTRVLLICRIDEGEESVLREIVFEGNNSIASDDLKGAFEDTEESKWWKFWKSAKFERSKFEKDKEKLVDFYKKHGFRDIEIISDSIIYNENKEDIKLVVKVNEGTKYYIRNIKWEGNTVFNDEFLNERIDMKKGEVYDYDKFIRNLTGNEKQSDVSSVYTDQGYMYFRPMPEEKKVGLDSLDVEIKVLENKRFKIDRVEITGNDRTQEKVLRRELYSIPGDYFSRSMLIRSLQQLANLQYFNMEKLYKEGCVPVPATDSTVNLTYKVEEKSSDYINASVGYSQYWGFSGSLGLTLSNFSLAHPFSQGGGQVLNFNWQFGVSNFYRTFSLGFTEPWFMDTPTSVGFNIFDTRQNYLYDFRQTGISLTVGRRLTWPDNYFNVMGQIRYQQNDSKQDSYYYPKGVSQQVSVGATISRTDIDDPIFPSRGSKFMLETELSGGPLPGNVDYYKILFKTDWYKSLFNTNKIVIYAGLDYGYIKELTANTPIPYFEKFALGGNGMAYSTTPLRGYEDRTVGPKQPGDKQTPGGNVMFKYTLELRLALSREPMPIYLLAFAEAGNVFESFTKANPFELKRSAGVGARILINPIGLIGFDYGYGFDRKTVDGMAPKWEFHFQFGKGL